MGLQSSFECKRGTTARRGILILINNNFSCDIGRTLVDPNGNFIIMVLKMSDKTITLASIVKWYIFASPNFCGSAPKT